MSPPPSYDRMRYITLKFAISFCIFGETYYHCVFFPTPMESVNASLNKRHTGSKTRNSTALWIRGFSDKCEFLLTPEEEIMSLDTRFCCYQLLCSDIKWVSFGLCFKILTVLTCEYIE